MFLAQMILSSALIYGAIGLLFAAAFVTVGASRLNNDARGTTVGFRLLILPASAALWPYLTRRWYAAGRQGDKP